MNNTTIKNILSELEQITDYKFLYEKNTFYSNKKVSITAKKEKLSKILDKVFKGFNVSIVYLDKQVVIKKSDIGALLNEAKATKTVNQEFQVTGTITDTNGQPLPGANIVEKGTTNGTQSDFDGKFSISVNNENAILLISYLGYITSEVTVGDKTNINISLKEDTESLDEIVVTALGIKRSTKTLGYSVTEVKGEKFEENKTLNFGTALTGKVAGVNVSTPTTGVTGSSRIIIRGNSSINGNNQPLFVVDGIPMDNSQNGSPGRWGGADWGDGLSAINSDEIESISVLKGNTAAALYGSRAQNGVILISTKTGSTRKGIGVEINSNSTFDVIVNPFDIQTEYGHGRYGIAPTTTEAARAENKYAFGARLDGSIVPYFDGVNRPYVYNRKNLLKDFYNIGETYNNSIAFSGGNEDHNVRVALNVNNTKPITPNSTFDRIIGSINYSGNISKKLNLSVNSKYSWQKAKNRPNVGDFANNSGFVLGTLPTTIDADMIIGDTNMPGTDGEGNEYMLSNDVWRQNPYFAVYQYERGDQQDRIINSIKLRYDLTDWMYIQGTYGFDFWNTKRYDITPSGVAHGYAGMSESAIRNREVNKDFLLGFNKDFNKLSFNGFLGGNQMRREYESNGANGSGFSIPNMHIISNLRTIGYNKSYNESGINSLYGSAEFGYNDYLYVTMTGRQDWYSTLDGRGIFYPSISLSAIATDILEDLNININSSTLSFAKLRASWAQVGGDAGSAYQTALTYSVSSGTHNGATLGGITQGYIPSTNLKPLTNTEWEVGLDLRLFKSKLGIDFSYYNRKTTDDILYSSVSSTSGYGSALVNIGQVNNKGYEVMINVKPFDKEFKWNATLNFSKNNNEVVKLSGDVTEVTAALSRTGRGAIKHIVGQPYSMVTGRVQKTIDGQKVYDANGFPVTTDEFEVLGQGVHDKMIGLSNSFSYKGFYLNAQIDGQFGGNVYSATNYYMIRAGLHKNTLAGRGEGLTVSGVDENGNAGEWTIANEDLHEYYKNTSYAAENVFYDASYIKLRELSIGYDLTKAIDSDIIKSMKISLVGRNLATLYGKIPNIDPESALNSSNAQGLEMFGLPTSRTYGLNLSVKF